MTAAPIALIVVGGQKCGTSSLLRYLAQHPDFYGHEQPECTFFVNADEHATGWEQIAPVYFPPARSGGRRLIAKSASLMCLPSAVERLAAHNPDIVVVAVLRDPTQRAYSAYLQARRKGLEDIRTFAEAVWASPARFPGNPWRESSLDYLRGGAYVRHLRSLLARFPSERVHVFLTEDLYESPDAICHTLFATLGAPGTKGLTLERRYNTAARARAQWLARAMAAQPPARRTLRRLVPLETRQRIRLRLRRMNEARCKSLPLDPTVEAELRAYFRPLNAELADLLGHDLTHWGV